jgi:hypothetical protein
MRTTRALHRVCSVVVAEKARPRGEEEEVRRCLCCARQRADERVEVVQDKRADELKLDALAHIICMLHLLLVTLLLVTLLSMLHLFASFPPSHSP